ncbi:MAG: septum formation initiator [Flavobacteriales bacterium]|nr:septum formation initiator [Flavobacteriales bacterium]|tara:strand:- start:308 stop:619 length:312 start_codon:yes stop_codon:yes gene_type:complete
MEIFKKIKNSKFFKIVSNLYILISVVFFIWIFFIDSNSILVNIKLNKEISELKERKDILENQIQMDKKIISNLQNPDSLEKYAREKLYMKKENEEIFIIEFEK